MENTFPSAETTQSPCESSPPCRPHCSRSGLLLSSLATSFWRSGSNRASHQIELDFHALIRAGDQLNGERINWIQARKPSPAVVWHGAYSCRKEGGESEGRGRRVRERPSCRKKNRELVRIKVKEDGDQTVNEGRMVTQLDVYTETGRGSEHLNDRQLVGCRISMSLTLFGSFGCSVLKTD